MANFLETYGTDDPRLCHLLKLESPDSDLTGYQVALLGFPYDEGFVRNGGREGAAGGPDSLRTLLPKIGTLFNPELNVDLTDLKVADIGNVGQFGTLEEAHLELRRIVQRISSQGIVPFVVGGGKDQAFPNARGVLEALTTTGQAISFTGINIDAYLDVRPLTPAGLAHSGSPYFQLAHDPIFQEHHGQIIEFGSQGQQCSRVHWNFVLNLGGGGGKIFPLSLLRRNQDEDRKATVGQQFARVLKEAGDCIGISFDMDCISSSDCPGVSAPAVYGLTAIEACQIAYEAGRSPKVKVFDVAEYNPKIEVFRTGRLLSLMFYNFLLGFKKRAVHSQAQRAPCTC